MATVLPGSPPGFSKDNVAGTVKTICSYLRSFHDNVDFQLGQHKKSLDERRSDIEALESRVKTLESGLTAAQADIGTLKTNYNALLARVAALEK